MRKEYIEANKKKTGSFSMIDYMGMNVVCDIISFVLFILSLIGCYPQRKIKKNTKNGKPIMVFFPH